ncbi:thioesterase family protein [Enterococcus sp. 669A]|uniref:Thioesterase family protein n=1 Tax=Candidatus Enterococcus moelleringii TaxID=2815325 RepID=A0ABS3LAY0_9ENTE|nr:thioesterase family protein [Enterococcus sp. 669A]MBO1306771.1 thioesterase family protein [Enterococcus sp. 669A]
MTKLIKTYPVAETATAKNVGSGDLAVLATPALLAMMENCAKELLQPQLTSEETSVGFSVEMKHYAPSPVGAEIVVTATITKQENKKVEFLIEVYEEDQLIGKAAHTRVIVNNEQFMRKMKENHNK